MNVLAVRGNFPSKSIRVSLIACAFGTVSTHLAGPRTHVFSLA